MPLPLPRPTHDDAAVESDRDRFLATWGALYDRLREGGRAQLLHAAYMAERQLGGTVYVTLPSKPARRDLPEAGYISDTPPGAPFGRGVLN